jgi:hypothetical protein
VLWKNCDKGVIKAALSNQHYQTDIVTLNAFIQTTLIGRAATLYIESVYYADITPRQICQYYEYSLRVISFGFLLLNMDVARTGVNCMHHI